MLTVKIRTSKYGFHNNYEKIFLVHFKFNQFKIKSLNLVVVLLFKHLLCFYFDYVYK